MLANKSIFRKYDIRGVVDKDLDAEFACRLGQALAYIVKREFGAANSIPQFGVGYDCRSSSPEFKEKFISGLLSQGLDALDCGMGPTPQLYHAVVSRNLSGGVQITASHNPGDENGFKIMVGGRTLSGGDILELRNLVTQEKLHDVKDTGAVEICDTRTAYLEDLVKISIHRVSRSRKLKVVVDAGNGVGGLIAPDLLKRLGCEVIELFTEPDGSFPNHHPDPTIADNLLDLRKLVVLHGADFGVAYDGDADRIGVIDERGELIFGDVLLILFGRQLIKEIKNPIIIGDVKCSDLLFRILEEEGAKTEMVQTGHSLIKAKLKDLGAHLAGEMSGHIFFADRYYGFDDAMHATARLVEILSNTECSLSDLLVDIPKSYSTPEIRFDCPEDLKFRVVDEVAQAVASDLPAYKISRIDGVRVSFPRGWGLVRASNTQSALIMRFEAQSEEELTEYREEIEQRVVNITRHLQ